MTARVTLNTMRFLAIRYGRLLFTFFSIPLSLVGRRVSASSGESELPE